MTVHSHLHPVLALKSRPWLLWGGVSVVLALAAIWAGWAL